jgi:hypothetical protein
VHVPLAHSPPVVQPEPAAAPSQTPLVQEALAQSVSAPHAVPAAAPDPSSQTPSVQLLLVQSEPTLQASPAAPGGVEGAGSESAAASLPASDPPALGSAQMPFVHVPLAQSASWEQAAPLGAPVDDMLPSSPPASAVPASASCAATSGSLQLRTESSHPMLERKFTQSAWLLKLLPSPRIEPFSSANAAPINSQ